MATDVATDSLIGSVTRSLDAADAGLSFDVARFLLSLHLSEQDRSRMNELAERNRQGVLSDAESDELHGLRQAAQFLDIFQLKARIALKSADSPHG